MIDVLVTSTCRKTFERTYESFIKNVKYNGIFNFIVHVDVLERGKQYLNKLSHYLKCNSIENVLINYTPKGHANAVNYLHSKLSTPFYFYLEDDWIFLKEISLDPLLSIMEKNKYIHNIRFSKEKIMEVTPYLRKKFDIQRMAYALPGRQINIDGIDLVESKIWSLNPHIGRASIAKKFSNIPIGLNPERYIWKEYPSKIDPLGLYIYGRIGEGHIVKDIGRTPIIIRKIKTFVDILKHPSLISKENRKKKAMAYRGWHDDHWLKL